MLGERLLQNGSISPDELQAALEDQRASGELFGDVLLRRRLVTEDELAAALAQETCVPFVAASGMTPDPTAVALVPEPFARRHLLVPLGFYEDALEVLQANPLDVVVIDDLQRVLGRPVQVVCATRSDVLQLIEAGYHGPVRSLEELGLSRRTLNVFHEALGAPSGLVLVAGPRGAGTTTTVHSALSHLGRRARNILTVDDMTVTGPDPDVIMVGEIGSAETAHLALREALAGALVVGTVRAPDAAGAVVRLLDLELEPDRVAEGLVAAIAQRLVRLICPGCRAPASEPAGALARVGLVPDPDVALYRGTGCERCEGSGYGGYLGVFEILVPDGAIRALVRERPDAARLREAAVAAGMATLLDDALSKALFGRITIEDVVGTADG